MGPGVGQTFKIERSLWKSLYFVSSLSCFGYSAWGSLSLTRVYNSSAASRIHRGRCPPFVTRKRESNHGHEFAAMPKSNCRNDMEDSSYEIRAEYSGLRYGFY
jgi:hypothetical protein